MVKELSFKEVKDSPLDETICRLLLEAGIKEEFENEVRQMIVAILKAGTEAKSLDLKIMRATLKEQRYANKVFNAYSEVRKISVFGSARTKPDTTVYQMAVEFGRKAADAGYMTITGAGPGIMQAVNEGAGPERSFGVGIQLPFEAPNPVMGDDNPRFVNFKYFFNRKLSFTKESDAIVVFPGGVGTIDEVMEVVTLIQTGKTNMVPVILVEEPNGSYWYRFVQFMADEMFKKGYISQSDFSLFKRVTCVDEALEEINRFYRRYESMRFDGKKAVLTLNSALCSETIGILAWRFKHILTEGGTIINGGINEDGQQKLIIDFDRRNYGGLRELIDDINRFQN